MSKYVTNGKKPHLGGNFADGDPACFCPGAWTYILEKYNIKSVMDVGSGCGHAAKFFEDKRLQVTAIEGLKENVDMAIFPTILHDLTEGPYQKTVDLVNCIEVVEHIEEKFVDNLMETLCQGSYCFMTHAVPGQKGWHHVNCQPSEYWIDHFQKRGYMPSEEDTKTIRELAKVDNAIHIARNGMFFVKG